LRNGGSKGRASRSTLATNISANANNSSSTPPSTSPTAFLVPRPEKRRKSKDDSPSPQNGNNSQNSGASANSQSSGVKKSKSSAVPCAVSPVLLECPEQDCSKKYKHANGLKYHQSHAHGIITPADEDSLLTPDSPQRSQTPPSSSLSDKVSTSNFSNKINFESNKSSNINLESKLRHDDPLSPAKATSTLNTEEMSMSVTNESNASAATASESATSSPQSDLNKINSLSNTTPVKIEGPIIARSKFSNLKLHQETVHHDFHSFAPIDKFGAPDLDQVSSDSIGEPQVSNSNFISLQPQPPPPSKTPVSSKSKKNRKSPIPDGGGGGGVDAEASTVNRSEGVRSPAYSDISDDSNSPSDNNQGKFNQSLIAY